MKKNVIILIASVLMLASCGTYTGEGIANGAYFGSMLGSAIGGINGGPRGYDQGTVIGMAGGAIIGAMIGSAKDKQVQEDRQQYLEEKARLRANRDARNGSRNQDRVRYTPKQNDNAGYDDSGFNPEGNADDRIDIDFGNTAPQGAYMGNTNVEIRNARFVDENRDGILSRGETAEVVFEVYNASNHTVYNIQPTVIETTKNKHILVSPSIMIESLGANSGVRYTAHIVADKMVKNGTAHFSVAVIQGQETLSQVIDYTVQTSKR